MIIEEDPVVSEPTSNTSASLHIPRIITQEALQAFTFDVMTHRLSEFTASKIQHPLNDNLNLANYCAKVIHPTNREIVIKKLEIANDPDTR